MARLEDVTVGSSVIGIAGNQPVNVVAVKWYGNAVLVFGKIGMQKKVSKSA